MKTIIIKLMIAVLLLSFASCASLTSKKTKTVYIKSNKEVKVLYDNVFVGRGKLVSFEAVNRLDNKLVTVIDVVSGTERILALKYAFNANVLANCAWMALPVWGWIGAAGLAMDLKTKSYVTLEYEDYYVEWETEKK